MRPQTWKLIGVAAVVIVIGVVVGLYVSKLTQEDGSPSYTVPVQTANGHPVVNLKIEMIVDGKTLNVLPPDDASHTFAVPAYGLVVPVAPVADDAKNQCDYAPCSMSTAHRTIQFTFHTGKAGHYRWQCFVPCAAGWLYGFGGPMQTIGYMDGFLDVV
jgi:hypothetical protein